MRNTLIDSKAQFIVFSIFRSLNNLKCWNYSIVVAIKRPTLNFFWEISRYYENNIDICLFKREIYCKIFDWSSWVRENPIDSYQSKTIITDAKSLPLCKLNYSWKKRVFWLQLQRRLCVHCIISKSNWMARTWHIRQFIAWMNTIAIHKLTWITCI